MKKNPLKANRKRMKEEFDSQSKIGQVGKTGLSRVAFTPSFIKVRKYAESLMSKAGMKTRVDAFGNLYGRKEGKHKNLPAVMIGSHLDSQNPGGRYDGPAGVLTALEAVRILNENKIENDHPIEVVAFAGEESSCGMTVFGSSAATGVIGIKEMKKTTHPPTGKSLYEIVNQTGGNTSKIKTSILQRKSIKSFLELHIEQGPILESSAVSIGVVDLVVGYIRGQIIFKGVSAHSGGQPMPYRRDSSMAAAEFMLEIESITKCAPESQRLTITFGEINARPGWISIVPGETEISFDLRGKNDKVLRRVLERMRKKLFQIKQKRKVSGIMRDVLRLPVCPTSKKIQSILTGASKTAGFTSLKLSSGGVHDACRMEKLCPMGMIFIPSVKGLSHTPEEFTHFSDLVKGAEVTALALVELTKKTTIL
ncbi:MAG: M20 family metallo-hydrolase [Nitrospinota bacterium]|nr:M20 family metallo-hydrolase [Nitrospinota bacterium]